MAWLRGSLWALRATIWVIGAVIFEAICSLNGTAHNFSNKNCLNSATPVSPSEALRLDRPLWRLGILDRHSPSVLGNLMIRNLTLSSLCSLSYPNQGGWLQNLISRLQTQCMGDPQHGKNHQRWGDHVSTQIKVKGTSDLLDWPQSGTWLLSFPSQVITKVPPVSS